MRRHRIGQLGIVVTALCLILLTWIGTYSAMEAERQAARSQIEADAYNQALGIGERFSVQMLGYEQTVRVIEREWEKDPGHFSLDEWRNQAVVLSDPSLDLFITDEAGVVRASTNPKLIGMDLSDQPFFQQQAALARDNGAMGIDRTGRGLVPDQWSITLVRRLDDREGQFQGVVGVSFRSASVADSYRRAPGGGESVMMLVGKGGRLRAISGPLRAEPGQSVASSDMYRAASTGQHHSWIGPSALDGVVRIHGFYRLPNRTLIVVVGYDRRQAMRASEGWRRGAAVFALGVTVFLILIAVLMLRDLRESRVREQRAARSRAALESAYAELKLAKARADAKSGQLETTFASMSDGVSLVDPDLRVFQWNERFCELTGLAASDLRIGQPFEELIRMQAERGEFGPVDTEAEVRRRMALLVNQAAAVVTERVRPNGTTIELRRAPLPSGGFVTLYTDITARKEAEAAQSRARAAAEAVAKEKSRFAAIVSHEIRTPLNMLLNSVEMLAQSGLSAQGREIAELAQQAGQALHGLLNDILELSALEAGRLSMRPVWFDVEPLLAGVLDLFRLQGLEPGKTLSLALDPDVPARIYADPIRLRQVLMNFVSNALKFSDPGEISLSARLEGEGAERCLAIAVTDPGPAIPEADRERLFRAFSRLEHPDGPSKPGSGLGLAICRLLVAIVGGEIGCDACQGSGNAFWLRLPCLAGPEEEGGEDGATVLPVLPRTRVLLVDDLAANRTVAAMLLGREGHAVDVAGSGAGAIAAASRSPYDVVLLDLSMPGMDGFETASRLRALSGPAGSTPIIALTAHGNEVIRAKCAASGMQDVVVKPIEPRSLLNAIRRSVWAPACSVAPPAAAEPSPAPALCPDRLSLLRDSMPDATIARMFEACLAELRGKLPPLSAALAAGDARAVNGELHAMTGVAASYGLAALDGGLRGVQAALGRGEEIDPAAVLAEIGRDLSRAQAAVWKAFATEPAS